MERVVMEKTGTDELNIIRTLTCLAVIFVHLTAIPVDTLLPDSVHMMIFSFLNRGTKFTTPTFIFLSGFTLFYAYRSRELKYGTFIKKRFKSALIPYFVWTLIYYRFFVNEGTYIPSTSFFLEHLFWAKMSYHLYFIFIIVQFYISFKLFLRGFQKWNPHMLLVGLLITNLLFLRYADFEYMDRTFLRYIFFFGLGCYGARFVDVFREKLTQWKWMLLLGYVAVAGYYAYQFRSYHARYLPVNVFAVEVTWLAFSTMAILTLYAFGFWLSKRSEKTSPVFKLISQSSFYIYLSHPLGIFLAERTWDELGIYSITGRFGLNVIFVYGFSVGGCTLYTYLKMRWQHHQKEKAVAASEMIK
ncbi:acyltransferase 3 [Alkaliphilus metalliredigens QYMF]|uniref:Acyltransferase 3 n=1 Tax=Alkaliphilus metalliredigens (strain QYMF) TaxID=293826 RepID=A6TK24_ALKMQ|nr:acyltransferase [Alkaliphilus metalliredigens]ABR46542.1 acyltransferase 3 [Alkaliphilus metalliredigens QYMF]